MIDSFLIMVINKNVFLKKLKTSLKNFIKNRKPNQLNRVFPSNHQKINHKT